MSEYLEKYRLIEHDPERQKEADERKDRLDDRLNLLRRPNRSLAKIIR